MSLVHELVKELIDDKQVTAVYGGGFKPPIYGHFSIVEKALKDFPEIDKFIIYIGGGVRDGISQDESLLVWNIYKKYLGDKVELVPSKGPIGDVIRYGKNNPDEIVYFIIGGREGREDDAKDIAMRTKGVEEKYPNMKVKVLTTLNPEMSGTNARKALKVSEKEFIKYLPPQLTDEEKLEVYNLVSPVVKEQLNENASYSKDIDIIEKCAQLTNYMREKGYNIDPLPAVEFVNGDTENARDFFGKTAYYDPNEQKIVLYTEGRHPKDIVRSYAHEMIHHIQNLEGRLGNITTQNTQEDDHLNDIEAEANLKGTMTFRNWTDSLNEIGDASAKVYPYTSTTTSKEIVSKADKFFSTPRSDIFYYEKVLFNFKTDKANYIVTAHTRLEKQTYINFNNNPDFKPGPPYKTTISLGFTTEGNDEEEVTNLNEQFSVLSTITNIVIDFIEQLNKVGGNVTAVYIPPKGDNIKDSKIDSKRGRLYSAYIKKNLSKIPGYTTREIQDAKGREAIAIYKTDNLKEDGQKISDKNMDNYKKDNNPKGVKDPFGLNAYAQELARGLEEALTIGDKEVERIEKPTNNPEDAVVIYKDGTSEPYLNTVKEGRKKKKDPKKGTGKKPKGSGRRLYTDEDPKDTVGVSFRTKEDIVDTLNKKSFKAKSHARQSQVINLIHQRVRAAYGRAKDPETKARLKRGLDYIEKRKEASKKKTQRLKAQKESLNEGRYDSLSRQLASITLNAWKSDFKDGAKYGYFEGKITPEEYPTDLTFMFKALGKFVDGDYNHNGYSRADGEVGVEYEIPKDAIPQIWEEVYMDLISTIRHEIEHQTQGGKNVKKGKGMASDQKLRQLIKKGGGDIVRYVTLPKEIESNVQGLYLKAKKWRRPYDEVADEYIKDFLKITDPADISYVKNKWQEVAKKRNLPSLLNEGRYDTLVNRLSSIVFEAFKDIHDRGDKEGEFEFRVDHPDEEHDIPSEEFYFDLAGKVVITDDEYEVNGGANAGFDKQGNEITPLLSVQFKIPKNPDWQRVSFDIKDVVRHELEHLTQDGENVKPGKQMDDDQTIRDLIDLDLLPKADYFRLPKEIDSMLQGLYFKAKKSKKPYIDVINDYLDTQPINAEERKNILKIWRSRAKALSLPVFETKYKLGKVMREQEETTEQQYKIYCDMDGVLTDFDTQFKELSGGIAPSDYESKNGREAFWSLISQGGVGYWVGMPWMPNGKELWEYISKYNPTILSAPSKENESRLGKRLWVRNNLSPKPKLILASAANKPNYSGRDKILIDDRPDTIANWNAKGGIGILFKSTAQVIEELKKLGL